MRNAELKKNNYELRIPNSELTNTPHSSLKTLGIKKSFSHIGISELNIS